MRVKILNKPKGFHPETFWSGTENLGGSGSHFAAFFRAPAAGFSAFPAVFHPVLRMLFAFFCTGIAYLSTFPAKMGGVFSTKAH
ncbi:MAG TPA: hypothetical protein VMR70_15610 [Flavisolibacter sp.]|nr:hypothetical protein [Flavisolibacter sp.]